MSEQEARSLYSYVVRTDSGFAPNPFGGYCTFACCKPQIRKHANIGDWIVGVGSRSTVGNEKMVYAMSIAEKLSFEEYAEDARFGYKIPAPGAIRERGDNIYFKDATGSWRQRPSYHREKQMERDLRGEYVLVSVLFFYFGAKAVAIPQRFRSMMSAGRWYRHVTGSDVTDFVAWLRAAYLPGIYGKPFSIASLPINLQTEDIR